jgi:hypothetical protein
MRVSVRMLLAILLGAIVAGCAPETVPTLRVWQPWTRVLSSDGPLRVGAKIKLEVSGTTAPLLGNETLEEDSLRNQLSQLLLRRGFIIDTSSFDYVIRLLYRTERRDMLAMSSTLTSTNTQAYAIMTGSGTGATSGLGVSIARAVGALSSTSGTVSEQAAEQVPSYTQTISVEFLTHRGVILWKGESTWDSQQLDLLSGVDPAFQLLLSYLPSREAPPWVPEVKMDHVDNYYRLVCSDKWFSCPALPRPIRFGARGEENTSIPVTVVGEPYAFVAYVDLIQTAENALPDGNEAAWKNPLNVSLWKHVTLGARYTLGPDKRPINVLVTLTGRSSSYFIAKCQVVSDAEFSKFSEQLSKWQEALRDYRDVYVR